MKSIQELFPRASKSFMDANPQLSAPNSGSGKQNEFTGNVERIKGKRGGHSISMSGEPYYSEGKPGRHGMNKTEGEYALILEAMKRKGEILRYEYEGITLRWADMRYTPDFLVIWSDTKVIPIYQYRFIEVKGGHIWDRDIVRFKGARAYWPEFQFEMWQKKKGQWNRLH